MAVKRFLPTGFAIGITRIRSRERKIFGQNGKRRPHLQAWRLVLPASLLLLLAACRSGRPVVAVIPRTAGNTLWEGEHAGAALVAHEKGLRIYYNAPTREDDLSSQLGIIERALDRGCNGIILSPVEALPVRTTIRRAVERGVPTVIVGTDLGIPPEKNLAYVLNNEQAGGELAARRVARILGGKGNIAIVGISSQLTSTATRARSLETALANEFHDIHVTDRRLGLSTVPQEQQVAEQLVSKDEPVNAIVALSEASTRGTYYALVEFNRIEKIKLIGFDQDLLEPVRSGGIDSVILQNTYEMGRRAMGIMGEQLRGESPAPGASLEPVLVTRDNIDSPQVRQMLTLVWWYDQ
jgi:ribose transport system substrate-binding protein